MNTLMSYVNGLKHSTAAKVSAGQSEPIAKKKRQKVVTLDEGEVQEMEAKITRMGALLLSDANFGTHRLLLDETRYLSLYCDPIYM